MINANSLIAKKLNKVNKKDLEFSRSFFIETIIYELDDFPFIFGRSSSKTLVKSSSTPSL